VIEKPPIEGNVILARLREEYELEASQIDFLALGADVNTAVYRVTVPERGEYFLKLRSGPFKETSVIVPRFLNGLGIKMILAPIGTKAGEGWGSLSMYRMVLYPYIHGESAYIRRLSEAHWLQFGSALAAIHGAALPPALGTSLPREEFSPQWRESLAEFQARVEAQIYQEPVAAELAAFMRNRRDDIDQVRERAEELANLLRPRRLDFVLCHSDLHPGNFLVADDGRVFLVDWDEAIRAPRERDLMFIGATGNPAGETEKNLFHRGYGPAEVDRAIVAYYRYERIVQDLAAFAAQLLLTDEGGRDRSRGLEYFKSNFDPEGEIEIARATDPRLAH
jgi:spectinomycin phosphotransferase